MLIEYDETFKIYILEEVSGCIGRSNCQYVIFQINTTLKSLNYKYNY